MRKFTFILPVAAFLLSAVVIASDFGSVVSAQAPEAVPATTVKYSDYDADDGDINAVTWTETSVRVPDSTKPRLPSPKIKRKKK